MTALSTHQGPGERPRPPLDSLAHRILTIRIEQFGGGEAGLVGIAAAFSLPPRTWKNYENGVTMPATALLQFLTATGANPNWLMTGRGARYLRQPGLSLPDRRLTADGPDA
jgi:hypothetical protein